MFGMVIEIDLLENQLIEVIAVWSHMQVIHTVEPKQQQQQQQQSSPSSSIGVFIWSQVFPSCTPPFDDCGCIHRTSREEGVDQNKGASAWWWLWFLFLLLWYDSLAYDSIPRSPRWGNNFTRCRYLPLHTILRLVVVSQGCSSHLPHSYHGYQLVTHACPKMRSMRSLHEWHPSCVLIRPSH